MNGQQARNWASQLLADSRQFGPRWVNARIPLSRWERNFLGSIIGWQNELSTKQIAVVERIVDKAYERDTKPARCEDAPCCGCCR